MTKAPIATTIGLDIAKQVFQVHGTDKSASAVLRRKLKRSEVVRFSEQPPCLVGIEASGSAHYWARILGGLGHTVRLMAPQFVKPYVKSQKSSAGKLYSQPRDICECGSRVLELYTCMHCGTLYGRAYTNDLENPTYLWSEPGETIQTAMGISNAIQPLDLLLEEPMDGVEVETAEYDLVNL